MCRGHVIQEGRAGGLGLLQTSGIFRVGPGLMRSGMPRSTWLDGKGRPELISSSSPHAQGGCGITWLSGTASSRGTGLPRSERLSNMLAKLVLSNIFENSVVWAFYVFSSAKTSLLTSLLLSLPQRKAKGL